MGYRCRVKMCEIQIECGRDQNTQIKHFAFLERVQAKEGNQSDIVGDDETYVDVSETRFSPLFLGY